MMKIVQARLHRITNEIANYLILGRDIRLSKLVTHTMPNTEATHDHTVLLG